MSASDAPGGNPNVQSGAAGGTPPVVADQIAELQKFVADHNAQLNNQGNRLTAVEKSVDELETAALDRTIDPPVRTAGVVMQDIVDFLHDIFPGQSAGRTPPGTPSHAVPSVGDGST